MLCYPMQLRQAVRMAFTRFNTAVGLVLVLVVLYVCSYYHSPCRNIEVGQTDLSTVTDSVLLDRRPLVIVDRVTDHQELVKLSAFRLLHIKSFAPYECRHVVGSPHAIASARFTIIYQSHSDLSHVEIRHPYTGAGAVIVLRRHQTLVLPPRWRFMCLEGATVHELHDCVSIVLRALGLTRQSKQSKQSKHA